MLGLSFDETLMLTLGRQMLQLTVGGKGGGGKGSGETGSGRYGGKEDWRRKGRSGRGRKEWGGEEELGRGIQGHDSSSPAPPIGSSNLPHV